MNQVTRASRVRRLSIESAQQLPAERDPFARESIEHLVSRYGSPLFVIDAARVRAQYRRLSAALPGVDLFYAIKCLPHAGVVAALRDCGGPFRDVPMSSRSRLHPFTSLDGRA